MNERVLRFNVIKGDAPVGVENRTAFWEQAKAQAALILEEAQEMYDAAQDENLVEMLDGYCDVRYTNDFMEHILDKAGVDIGVAYDQVQMNNDQKYTVVYDFALQSAATYPDGTVTIQETEYEGTTYYTVRDVETGKCLKLLKHVPPQLSLAIPSSTMQMLGKQE